MQPKPKDARRVPRAKLCKPIGIRPFDPHCQPEVCTTLNLSRHGTYFETSLGQYFSGKEIAVTRNFDPDDTLSREEIGEVVRVEKLPNGKWGVAVRIFPMKLG